MVRKYQKKSGARYMKRSRLSEPQFIAIASGYINLMTATELEADLKSNGANRFKMWSRDIPAISRNSINKIYDKLNERLSLLVESGWLGNNFPYGMPDDLEPEKREVWIDEIISPLYLLLTNKISKEKMVHIHNIWRDQGQGYLYDSPLWFVVSSLWKGMSGLNKKGLRYLFNRAAYCYYFADAYQNSTVYEASESSLSVLLEHLENYPLE